ncbi:hypothetical protein DFH11DRAFT_1569299 [Phellopilus nigrolimitatus]|nr:hypothetical protein DFH11DRAFT_1569299 [Phellopilus nigrolimitatus]
MAILSWTGERTTRAKLHSPTSAAILHRAVPAHPPRHPILINHDMTRPLAPRCSAQASWDSRLDCHAVSVRDRAQRRAHTAASSSSRSLTRACTALPLHDCALARARHDEARPLFPARTGRRCAPPPLSVLRTSLRRGQDGQRERGRGDERVFSRELGRWATEEQRASSSGLYTVKEYLHAFCAWGDKNMIEVEVVPVGA